MRRNTSLVAFLAAFALLTLASTFTLVQAETLTTTLTISPLNEVPPITGLNATGGFLVTITVVRDPNGNIVSGTMNYTGVVNFPGAVTLTGFHIHEGGSTVNGPVRFGTDLSGSNTLVLANGTGIINKDVVPAPDPVVLGRLLANPAGFYLNLHSTVNPGGAMRGQLSKLTETLANTVTMTPAQEVPPITGLNASATAAIIANPTRNAQGVVNGGSITFNIVYQGFPANTTFTGLHIHEGAAGANGGVVFDTGTTGASPIVSASGSGVINITVPVTAAARIAAFGRMAANPTGFYVNLHTTVNPGGAVRAQLTALSGAPAIALVNRYFLPTGSSNATLTVLATGIDLLSTVLINGQMVTALPDLATGNVLVTVPAALLANPGVLQMQVRSGNGVLSNPAHIVVAAQSSVNTINVATVDAAGYGTAVAPESIAAAFGARLASQVAFPPANATILPTSLDGTSVYVNGVAASLFFVSGGQINYLIPEGATNGLGAPATVIVLARDGTVSQGTINIRNVAPGIFTRLANGRGAPAAVASADGGMTYPILMGNAEGVPTEIAAGNIVVLFGTGLRFKSGDVTATAGGVTATPSFAGAQGSLFGLDQINLTIPAAMAGRGEMDLVFTMDNQMTNAVRIRVR